MTCKILIVEDQPLIALTLEDAVIGLGYEPVGIAATARQALSYSEQTDVALVDVNLLDGPTGPDTGKSLAERGVSVLFMTSSPEQLNGGVPGTLGVMTKPMTDSEAEEAIRFAVNKHAHRPAKCPETLREFA